MLQSLLTERLNLKGHWEKRPLAHLALVIGKNGSKLKPSRRFRYQSSQLRTHLPHQITMPLLATLLSRFERQTIVDETGLPEFSAVQLDWSRDTENRFRPHNLYRRSGTTGAKTQNAQRPRPRLRGRFSPKNTQSELSCRKLKRVSIEPKPAMVAKSCLLGASAFPRLHCVFSYGTVDEFIRACVWRVRIAKIVARR